MVEARFHQRFKPVQSCCDQLSLLLLGDPAVIVFVSPHDFGVGKKVVGAAIKIEEQSEFAPSLGGFLGGSAENSQQFECVLVVYLL